MFVTYANYRIIILQTFHNIVFKYVLDPLCNCTSLAIKVHNYGVPWTEHLRLPKLKNAKGVVFMI